MHNPIARRFGAVAVTGGLALIGWAALAGCGTQTEPGPPPSPSTTSTTPPSVQPGEKALDPRGGNLFTPSHTAPPAPTQPPGVHRNN